MDICQCLPLSLAVHIRGSFKMIPMQSKLLSADLDYILENTRALWEALRDQRIFITGGTGFFGCWLLESFLWANASLNLNATAVVLTRNIDRFNKKCPHLVSSPALTFQEGDVANFTFPEGHFSHVIHAATEASLSLNKNNPELMRETIVQGTRHTLDFARQCGAKQFLLTSSGAIYGKQPSHITHIHEEDIYPQETIASAYAEGKREAETLCAQYAEHHHLDIKIARCFAFVGPYLPLDTHFAVGNFIRDGFNGDSIVIKSDGSPYRSYLYAADLAIWLWTILFRGEAMRPYNVGSDESITIKDLAGLVASLFEPNSEVHIKKAPSGQLPERYVPDVSRVRDELNLRSYIGLKQAVKLTKEWHDRNDNFKVNKS